MTRSLIYTSLVLVGLASARANAADHTKDSPDTVKKALADKKAVLIDVREQTEWDAGHLQAAQLLPLSKLKGDDIKDLLKDLPKDKPIYAHCKSGGRCMIAADILIKQGYDVRPLKQGYQDLLEAGFTKAKK